jgi:hypothetical protein
MRLPALNHFLWNSKRCSRSIGCPWIRSCSAWWSILPTLGGPPVVAAIPFADFLSVELGSVLLFAWLSIRWAKDGNLACARIFFNSVGETLFAEMVKRISRAWAPGWHAVQRAERCLDLLNSLPYKFKNIITNRLLLQMAATTKMNQKISRNPQSLAQPANHCQGKRALRFKISETRALSPRYASKSLRDIPFFSM